MLEEFPAAGDPVVAALVEAQDGGADLLVEALRRPERAAWRHGRRVPARHWEDQNAMRRARSAVRASVRRRRFVPGALAPAVDRLARADRGAVVLAEPAVASTAERVVGFTGRADLRVEVLEGERDSVASRLGRLGEPG